MELLKIAFVLALACASVISEAIFHKGDQIEMLWTSNTKSNVTLNGKELMNSELNITVKRDSVSSPPRPEEVEQVYQLVDEHVASMQAMPQEANVQEVQKCDFSRMSGNITVQIGNPQPQAKTYVNISKVVCTTKPNATST